MSLLSRIIGFFKPGPAKNAAILSYIKELRPTLIKIYGRHARYNEMQIRYALKREHLSEKWIQYAFAMFMSKHAYQLLGFDLPYKEAIEKVKRVRENDRKRHMGRKRRNAGWRYGNYVGALDYLWDAFHVDSTAGVNFGSSYSGGWNIPGGGGGGFSGFGGGSFGGGGAGGSW